MNGTYMFKRDSYANMDFAMTRKLDYYQWIIFIIVFKIFLLRIPSLIWVNSFFFKLLFNTRCLSIIVANSSDFSKRALAFTSTASTWSTSARWSCQSCTWRSTQSRPTSKRPRNQSRRSATTCAWRSWSKSTFCPNQWMPPPQRRK